MAIKRILSAGGIVIKVDKGQPLVLVTQHSGHKGWDFPKGHREIYESAEQTAPREVEEETGVKAKIIEKVGQTEYFYYDEGPPAAKASEGRPHSAPGEASRGKEKVLKTVTYFLMKYKSEGEASTAFEVSDMTWLPVDAVEDKLTFRDTKDLWKKAREKISKLLKGEVA